MASQLSSSELVGEYIDKLQQSIEEKRAMLEETGN